MWPNLGLAVGFYFVALFPLWFVVRTVPDDVPKLDAEMAHSEKA